MKAMIFAGLMAGVMGLGGCITSKTVSIPTDKDVSLMRFESTHRVVSVREKNGRVIVVSEPSPDIAKEIMAKLDSSVSGIQGQASGNAKLEYATSVVDLAKRSQALQIQREAMFRIEEMDANGAFSNQEVVRRFDAVLVMVGKIAEAELQDAKAKSANAEAKKTQAENEKNRMDEAKIKLLNTRLADLQNGLKDAKTPKDKAEIEDRIKRTNMHLQYVIDGQKETVPAEAASPEDKKGK